MPFARLRKVETEKAEKDLAQNKTQELPKYPEKSEYKSLTGSRLLEGQLKERAGEDRIFAPPPVAGFEKSGVMTNEEVRSHLEETFPDRHANSYTMDVVRYQDEYREQHHDITLAEWENRELVPNTEINQETITVYRQTPAGNPDAEALKDTLAHEVGHHVHLKYLGPEERRGWLSLSGERAPEQCVSDYARTNAYEDFAETYQGYTRRPEALQQINPDKYAYMRDRVFSGREYVSESGRHPALAQTSAAVEKEIKED